MNTDTGEVYRGLNAEQLKELTEQFHNIVPVAPTVADAVEIGMKALRDAESRYLEKVAQGGNEHDGNS